MGSVATREARGPNNGNYVQTSTLANNVEISLSVEEFFSSLWKDVNSKFYHDFLTASKCFEIKVEDWWLQESTYTIHRNIFTKHKNNSKTTGIVQTVDTIKEQRITYNPQDKELTINEVVTYHGAPYSHKFKIYIVWKVTEMKTEILKNISTKQCNIHIDARIEFHETLKGKKIRAKIAEELFAELKIEYFLYYQQAQKFTQQQQNENEQFVFEQIETTRRASTTGSPSPVKRHSAMTLSSKNMNGRIASPTLSPFSSNMFHKDRLSKSNSNPDLKDDDVSSLSSISVPPCPDTSDDEDSYDGGSKYKDRKQRRGDRSTSPDTSETTANGSAISLSIMVHYGIITYYAMHISILKILPADNYDICALYLAMFVVLAIAVRLYSVSVTYQKLFKNFLKFKFGSVTLALYALCIVLTSDAPVHYYTLYNIITVYVLLPLLITACTTILRVDTVTKVASVFMSFVRIYALIVYTFVIQLPYTAIVLPYLVRTVVDYRILYMALLNLSYIIASLNGFLTVRSQPSLQSISWDRTATIVNRSYAIIMISALGYVFFVYNCLNVLLVGSEH